MQDLGKILVVIGAVLVLLGAVVWKTGGLGGLGRLPGDIFIQRGGSTFYFPVVTCLIASIAISVLMWLFRK